MASLVVTVCDQCVGEGRLKPSSDVHRYVVRDDTRRASLTLCSEHAAPLELLLGSHQERPVRARIDTARIESMHKTMEEIERLRDQWRKRHAG